MKTETKVLAGVLGGTLVLIIGAVFFLSKSQTVGSVQDNKIYQIDYSKGEKIGSDSARVKLVEFGDFQCPACLSAEPYVKDILSKNPGKVQLIFKNFPLSQHKFARMAAEIGEEANNQGKFEAVYSKLYETQDLWIKMDNPKDYLINLATELGIDGKKVSGAIEKNTYDSIIEADVNEGLGYGVNATPTFFLNGRKLNLNNFADLQKEVDKAINSSN